MTIRKRKPKPRAKKVCVFIDVPIYGGWVIVSINQTDKEYMKSYMKLREITEPIHAEYACSLVQKDSEYTMGRTAHYEGNVMIRIYNDLNRARDYNTLVHELLHATDFMLDYRGMKLVDGSDEAYAYLIGYLMEKIMDAYL
jgi:hypothetical protein